MARPDLDALLELWDRGRTARYEAAEVGAVLALCARLLADKGGGPAGAAAQAAEALRAASDGDGKASRAVVRAAVAALPAALGGRPPKQLEDVIGVLLEMQQVEELFEFWTGGRTGALPLEDANSAVKCFNRWSLRAHPEVHEQGRITMNYYDRGDYGSEVNIGSFTRWVCEEIHILEESFDEPWEYFFPRVTVAVRTAKLLELCDWSASAALEASELRGVFAALQGRACVKPSEEEEQLVQTSLAGDGGNEGALNPELVRKWIKDTVARLDDAQQLACVLDALEQFVHAHQTLSKVHAFFKRWDHAGSGVIEARLMRKLIGQVSDLGPQELDALLGGAEGDIDYTEFTKWVLTAPEAP